MTASPDATSSHEDRQRLVLRLAELGIPTTDTARQRHVCAVWTKGRARRRSDLTVREVGSLYARLREPDAADALARALSMPDPGADPEPVEQPPARPSAIDAAACLASWDDVPAEPELPADVIVCGGEPSDADVATVAAFAIALDAGPAAIRAFALDGEDAERELAAAEQAPDEPGHDLAACEEHPDCRQVAEFIAEPEAENLENLDLDADVPAPVVVPCEPPVEDVEAAAEEAVRRFRERQAAGIVPQPPDLSTIPPRVPVPYVKPPGHGCPPAICWCGGPGDKDGKPLPGACDSWKPAPPVDYSKTPGSRDYERIYGRY